ncbi:unnamed protein product, partial [Polarella glacialis]
VVGPAARPVTSKRANTEIKRPDPYDPKWKTNVFGFRKALRDAFRHMPYLDFVAFMDFLLRSLHRIKDAPGSFTWHSNDPSFRFTMGIRGHNKYTTSLLFKMGFVQMTEEYWIWPSVHLKPSETGAPIWGQAAVPRDNPGLDQSRLDDMVSFITQVVSELNHHGKEFTGHVNAHRVHHTLRDK